jgi:hypothetical protein
VSHSKKAQAKCAHNQVPTIDVQLGRTPRHDTDTPKQDTIWHDTARHERLAVSCRASTPCRLLGPNTTRTSFSRVVPARRHGKHVVLLTRMLHGKKKERSNPNTSAKIKDYHKDESQLSRIQIKSERNNLEL